LIETTKRPVRKGFYASQLGKKYAMAITGIILFGYVLLHMLGNLKLFLGAESLNHYAEWLRELLTPLLPRTGALWLMRGGLALAFVVHVVASAQLTMANRRARPVRYSRSDYVAANYASRTMRWTGIIIALFVIYHLAHLTWGNAHPDFVRGDVHHNMVVGFQMPPVVAVYILANLALGLHLYHGLWSLFQTMGWNNPRFNHLRTRFAQLFAAVITLGNIAMPLAVIAGFVRT
jgi:succinate dehydrogenase / fumarate reductase, cytochrome b subunit